MGFHYIWWMIGAAAGVVAVLILLLIEVIERLGSAAPAPEISGDVDAELADCSADSRSLVSSDEIRTTTCHEKRDVQRGARD